MGPPGAADTASRRKTAGGATVSLLPGLRKRKPGLRGNPAGRGLGGKPPSPRRFPASRKTWNRRAGNPPSAVAWGKPAASPVSCGVSPPDSEERGAKLDPLGAASLVAAAAAARALALPRLLHAMDHIRKRANNDSSHNNQLNVHIFLPLCRHGMKKPFTR